MTGLSGEAGIGNFGNTGQGLVALTLSKHNAAAAAAAQYYPDGLRKVAKVP